MKKWLDRIGYVSLRMYLVVLLCLVIPVFLTFGFIQNQYEQYIQDQLSDQIVSSILKSEEVLYDTFRSIAGISSAIVTNNALRQGLDREGQSYYSINKMFDECVNYAQINKRNGASQQSVGYREENRWSSNPREKAIMCMRPRPITAEAEVAVQIVPDVLAVPGQTL